MAQKSTKRKKVIIASALIVVLVIASIGALIVYNQLTATQLRVTISPNETNILQGNRTKIPIKISLAGNLENVELTSIVNSSKINCNFDPANGSSSFNSTLTVNVDDSAQGGNYIVNVKALSQTATANASCIITVLSRNVTVSGKVNITLPSRLSDWDVVIDSLMFEDTRTDEKVTITYGPIFSVVTTTPQDRYTFTVTLQNQDFYYVTASYGRIFVSFEAFPRSDVIGNLTVSAQAGNNMMTGQDFTLTPQY